MKGAQVVAFLSGAKGIPRDLRGRYRGGGKSWWGGRFCPPWISQAGIPRSAGRHQAAGPW
jgi:hypothetical protein